MLAHEVMGWPEAVATIVIIALMIGLVGFALWLVAR